MEIELRHLRLVRALGDAGSVTKAASTVGATQPAVSRQLNRIEDTLGGPLFERSRAGVRPTALGKLVIARARAILPAVESLHADADAVVADGAGPAQLSLGARIGPAMMGLVNAVQAIFPETQVIAESEVRIEAILEMATAGRVDAAVINEFVGHEIQVGPDVDRHSIAVQPVFLMLAEDHPLAAKDEVALADLADESWVLDPLDLDREYDVFAAVCDTVGFQPRVEHYLHGSPNVEFIRSGGYVGLCYPMAEFSGIVTRPIADADMQVRHVLLAHRRSFLAPHARTLVRHVVLELESGAERTPTYAAWRARHTGI